MLIVRVGRPRCAVKTAAMNEYVSLKSEVSREFCTFVQGGWGNNTVWCCLAYKEKEVTKA